MLLYNLQSFIKLTLKAKLLNRSIHIYIISTSICINHAILGEAESENVNNKNFNLPAILKLSTFCFKKFLPLFLLFYETFATFVLRK